ncbi:DUF3761 domain-containing protein [Acetobacter okinawensis]|nr:DUF3761 domain-containing protein [Acetobacter okinawensis]
MKFPFKALLALLPMLSLIPPAYALDPTTYQPGQYQQLDESQLLEHKHYTNKEGKSVHSPAHTRNGEAPPGASAKCGDGSYSFSLHHRGTCSHHGGVVSWLG